MLAAGHLAKQKGADLRRRPSLTRQGPIADTIPTMAAGGSYHFPRASKMVPRRGKGRC